MISGNAYERQRNGRDSKTYEGRIGARSKGSRRDWDCCRDDLVQSRRVEGIRTSSDGGQVKRRKNLPASPRAKHTSQQCHELEILTSTFTQGWYRIVVCQGRIEGRRESRKFQSPVYSLGANISHAPAQPPTASTLLKWLDCLLTQQESARILTATEKAGSSSALRAG